MKLKALLVAALFALGVTAAVATAGPPPGKGKEAALAAKHAKLAAKAAKARGAEKHRCRGGHAVLHGELVSVNLGSSELTMLVGKANKHGRSHVGANATVVVNDKTKVRRHGKSSLDELQAGDRLLVLVRACRDAEGDRAMLAKLVVARASKTSEEDESSSTETSTTESTTTETSTTP